MSRARFPHEGIEWHRPPVRAQRERDALMFLAGAGMTLLGVFFALAI